MSKKNPQTIYFLHDPSEHVTQSISDGFKNVTMIGRIQVDLFKPINIGEVVIFDNRLFTVAGMGIEIHFNERPICDLTISREVAEEEFREWAGDGFSNLRAIRKIREAKEKLKIKKEENKKLAKIKREQKKQQDLKAAEERFSSSIGSLEI